MICPGCGLAYDAMRTGLSFAEVRAQMYSSDPDPSTWRNKRRHGVLGYWRELKLMQWDMHLGQCAPDDVDF